MNKKQIKEKKIMGCSPYPLNIEKKITNMNLFDIF